MKARVKNQALAGIWLYLPAEDGAVTEAVRTAAAACGAGFAGFGPELTAARVADILSGDARPAAEEGESPSEPVLLMDGLDKAGLDRFLAALREQFQSAGLPVITLKAIVTPVNRSWIFCRLAKELCRERQVMSSRR